MEEKSWVCMDGPLKALTKLRFPVESESPH